MRLISYIILYFFLIFSYRKIPHKIDNYFILIQLIFAIVVLFLRYTDKKKTVSLSLKHSNLFIFSYVIVYYQLFIDLLLGLSSVDSSFWVDASVPCYSILYANFGLLSFQFGYYLYGLKHRNEFLFEKNKEVKCGFNSSVAVLNKKGYKSILVLLHALAILFLILYIGFADKEYLIGGYGFEKDPGTIANYMATFFSSVMLVLVACKSSVYRKDIKGLKDYIFKFKVEIFLYACYIFLIILSGARHAAINCLCVLFIGYYYSSQKRFNLLFIFLTLLVGSFLFSILAYVRTGDSNVVTSIMDIKTISPFTHELANSLGTLNFAVYYVPSYYPFNMGLTIFGFLFLIIPGGRAFVLNYFSVPQILWDSTFFITYLAFGYDATYGLGSSCVADIYISFGLPGIIIIFFFFGFIIHKIEFKTFVKSSKSLYFMILTVLFYSQMFFIARESLFTLLFGISYPLLIMLLFNLFNIRIYENRSRI